MISPTLSHQIGLVRRLRTLSLFSSCSLGYNRGYNRGYRQSFYFVVLLAISLFFPALTLAAGDKGQLALPSGDLVAPEVIHEVSNEPLVPGQPYTVSVKATDNVGVKNVTLFYRVIGSAVYKRVPFNSEGDAKYSVVLPGTEVANPGIEYYVQTEDLAGNTLLTGYSFSPLIVKVQVADSGDMGAEGFAAMGAGESFAGDLNRNGSGAEPIWKNKWLWIGVAAVVGGVALSAGNDNSGSGSKGGGGDQSPATITACVPNASGTNCQ